MEGAACADGRCRGMYIFYGANRTGRFSSRLVQMQNLARNSMADLSEARALVREGGYGTLEMLYDDIPDTLSQLVRTAFIPAEGKKFYVADFSAIEARVIAWLAGEQWVLDTFARNGDIYCETASRMFGVPVVKHGANGELRQKGKQATLACSYGGSVGALKAMGAIEAGMKEEELRPLVDAWRQSNPNIVRFWRDLDSAVKRAVREHSVQEVRGLKISCRSGMLFITLPSGRDLAYVKPAIGWNRFGGESVTYEGAGMAKKWERIETFGGKIAENCLAEGTLVLTDQGLIPIELISEKMKIWDGEEWVTHGGIICQGIKDTISVDDVRMTPDHRILTERGWIKSGESEGLNWADISLPYGFEAGGEQPSGKIAMAVQMCLRERKNHSGKSSYLKGVQSKILRMQDPETDLKCKPASRDEPSSCIWGLAFHETEMHGSNPSRVSQLRRTGDRCLRAVEEQFRELLGGHGANMEERTRLGQDRQQCRVFSGELSLVDKETELPEQKNYQVDSDSILAVTVSSGSGTDGNRKNDSSVSNRSRMAGRISVQTAKLSEYVYDIRNCGPRHRFTVWNGKRFCIVSNCTQAIARDILLYAMKTLRCCSIVGHVHDEIIIEADPEVSLEAICEQMGRVPPWAEGLVLRADGYTCDYYRKD